MGWLLLSEHTLPLQTKESDRSQSVLPLLNGSSSWAGLSTTNDDLDHDSGGGNQFATLHVSIHLICFWVLLKKRCHYHRPSDSIVLLNLRHLWNLFRLNELQFDYFSEITTNLRRTFTSGRSLLRRSCLLENDILHSMAGQNYSSSPRKVGSSETTISIQGFHSPNHWPVFTLIQDIATKIDPHQTEKR